MSSNSGDFFDSNLKALRLRYPAFRDEVESSFQRETDFETVETREGGLTAKTRGVWLHSGRAPSREAEKIVSAGIEKNGGLCLVYGFGLGYHVEALLKLYDGIRILVIEASPQLFLSALETRDFRAVIENPRIGFLFRTPASALGGILRSYGNPGIQTLKLKPLFDIEAGYYGEIDERLQTFLSTRRTNMNTLKRFGKSWIRNLFRNSHVFSRAADVGRWFGMFKDIPALVIAAGPSLDEILPHIRELRDRYLLICVDTALRSLLENGVAPDFIVVVDPQYLNTRHLDNCLDSALLTGRSALISESSTHPAIFRSENLPVYFFKSIFPLGKLLESRAGISSPLGAGGSVSTTAWDFARRCGCSEICCSGLDLGFPGRKTHCKRSLSPLVTELRAGRLKPAETTNHESVNNADPFLMPSNGGGEVLTDNRLIIYKWWFEQQAEKAVGDLRLLNSSEGGVKIDGMERTTLVKMLEKPVVRPAIDGIKEAMAGISSEQHDAAENFREILSTVISECSSLESVCRDALSILDRIDADPEYPRRIAYNRLSELDSAITSTSMKELSAFIIQPVLNEIIENEGDGEDNSRKLYSSLLEACSFHRIEAERALARLA